MQSHEQPMRLHCDPCVHYVRPRSSCCVVGDLTARLWRPYGDPTVLLLEHRVTAERRHLFLAYSKCTPSLGILCDPTVSSGDPTALPPRCCSDGCDRTLRTSAFCNMLGRRGNTVRTPPWCDKGPSLQT